MLDNLELVLLTIDEVVRLELNSFSSFTFTVNKLCVFFRSIMGI